MVWSSGSQAWAILYPRKHWVIFGDRFLVVTTRGGIAIGI